jgi:O-antigen/teichoic acid export membrane protein
VEEVAIYAATTRLVKLVTVSLIVIYEAIAPMIVELNSKNNKVKLQRVLRVAATIAAIPTSMVLILFIFKSSEVLGYLYGEYYKEGVGIMIILSIGQLVNVWSGLSNYTLSITGYHKINMYIVSFVAVVAIMSCLFFVREHGAYAVALIISIAWIIQNILAVIMTRYLVGVWTPADIYLSFKELRSYLSRNNGVSLK